MTTNAASRLTLKAMKLIGPGIILVCIVGAFITTAGEQLSGPSKGATNQPVAGDLQPLQGTWVGVAVGEKSDDKYTVTINSNSFHFHRDAKFWFATTIALRTGTNPRQLHATIKECAPGQESSVGKVVGAIFKIEKETLILATSGGADETPESFEGTEDKPLTRYDLQKVQPQKKKTPPAREPTSPN